MSLPTTPDTSDPKLAEDFVVTFLELEREAREQRRKATYYCVRMALNHGWSVERIARALDMTQRQVSRIRVRTLAGDE